MKKKLLVIALSSIITIQSTFIMGMDCNVFAAEIGNTAATTTKLIGDVNGDTSVDAIDFALLKSYLLEVIKELPVSDYLVIGDLNCDGSINAIDLALTK